MIEKKDSYLVSYMPWAGLKGTISIGPVSFIPFKDLKEGVDCSAEIFHYLDEYFKRHIDLGLKPVDTVTVCKIDKMDFRHLQPEETDLMRSAIDVYYFAVSAPMFLGAVASDNRSIGPPSADKYVQYYKRFKPDDSTTAISEGSLTQVWSIHEVSFMKPLSIGGDPFGSFDDDFLKFGDWLLKNLDDERSQRILRALELYKTSHYESYATSIVGRIVMMGTAFEILLNVPEETRGKASYMAEQVEALCTFKESVKATRVMGKKQLQIERCLISWWLYDYYKLRNDIVHGKKVTSDRFRYSTDSWLSQLIVADVVFYQIIEKLMIDLISESSLGQPIDPEDIDARTAVLIKSMKFTYVHKALGWLLEDKQLVEETHGTQLGLSK